MKKSIAAISIASILLLVGCKKEMSPAECQEKYNTVRASFDARADALVVQVTGGALDPDEFERRMEMARSQANAEAAAYDDCCCWSPL